MFKLVAYFCMCLKVAKIGISNINQALLSLKTYQVNLYFIDEISQGFIKDIAHRFRYFTCKF